jgi:hypothetical protein
MTEQKDTKLQDLATRFTAAFNRSELKEHYSAEDMEYSQLLVRLNAMSWQSYYNELKNMKEWPWDTNILAKFYFTLLIPVVVTFLSSFVMQSF